MLNCLSPRCRRTDDAEEKADSYNLKERFGIPFLHVSRGMGDVEARRLDAGMDDSHRRQSMVRFRKRAGTSDVILAESPLTRADEIVIRVATSR